MTAALVVAGAAWLAGAAFLGWYGFEAADTGLRVIAWVSALALVGAGLGVLRESRGRGAAGSRLAGAGDRVEGGAGKPEHGPWEAEGTVR